MALKTLDKLDYIRDFSIAKTALILKAMYESHPKFARLPDNVVCYSLTNPPKYV